MATKIEIINTPVQFGALTINKATLVSDGTWGYKLWMEAQQEGVHQYKIGPSIMSEDRKELEIKPGCYLRWNTNELGLVAFGVWYDDANLRPGHHGHWSSNSGYLNELQDEIQVTEQIVINGMSVAIEIGALRKLLNEFAPDFTVESFKRWDNTYYRIKKNKEKVA